MTTMIEMKADELAELIYKHRQLREQEPGTPPLILNDVEFNFEMFIALDLTDIEFVRVNFNNCVFETVDFDGSRFNEVNFGECKFIKVGFRDVDMHKTTFIASKFTRINLKDSRVRLSDFSECGFGNSSIIHSTISTSDIKNAYFKEVSFADTRLSNCNLRGSAFFDADLRGTSLIKVDLTEVEFNPIKVKFEYNDFRGSFGLDIFSVDICEEQDSQRITYIKDLDIWIGIGQYLNKEGLIGEIKGKMYGEQMNERCFKVIDLFSSL